MAKLQTAHQVEVEELRRTLSEALGPSYRVTAQSGSTLKVGRTGVIPSRVKLSHTNGGTTFTVQTTGLILSRLVQAATINPRVRGVLEEVCARKPN